MVSWEKSEHAPYSLVNVLKYTQLTSVVFLSIMSVLAAIGVLIILIIVHELGHFAAARWQGIHVDRFAIGFGPILLRYQGKKTEYSLRAFPLGGYVGFPDDDPDSTIPPEDPDLLRNRPLLDRAIVISAGVIANLIFAYLLLVTQAATVGFQNFNYQPGVVISQVITVENSAAYQAGIEDGDIILTVGDRELAASQEAIQIFQKTIQNSPQKPLKIKIQRGEEILFLDVTPEANTDGQGKIGVLLTPHGEVVRQRTESLPAAFIAGANEYQRLTNLIVRGFGKLILNFQENVEQVAGPVAIVAVGAQLAQDNLGNLLQFGSLISINLAIINILPLPALDGGQLAFLLIEGLLGKPLPNKIQDGIMQTGLVLLLSLGIFLIVRDTANLAFFQDLFQ